MNINLKYPSEEDVKIMMEASVKFKKVRAKNMLNAINYNKPILNERIFDRTVQLN